jgi:ribonuclease Y
MEPISIILAVAGLGAGYFGAQILTKNKIGSADKKAQEKLDSAKKESESLKIEAEKEALSFKEKAQQEVANTQRELKDAQKRALERESNLDSKLEDLDKRSQELRKNEEDLVNLKEEIKQIRARQEERLEKVAKLNKEEAREQLFKMVEKDISTDLMNYIAKRQKEAERTAEERSQEVILSAMERIASEVTAERTITAIKIDDDQIKGRIIGKEGRNIQALQKATGVDILMDETPGMIVLSCFDPVRRQVARVAIENLIKDGRIQPAKIEEAVEKAQKNIDKDIERAAEDACREVGITGLPPQIMRHLGELKFRTSYGQNVLKHSTEMAHIAGLIAGEIGANIKICKTAALLHDLGKALTHKIEGKHHLISGDLLRKYGLGEEIAHAAEAHHEDIDATTSEAMVVRVVDSLSAARPGARNISAENFSQRMKDLENTATSFPGVEKAYAITAGREVRVIVESKKIDDLSAFRLARDIADKIESTMSYPGTIKINVIRETRAIEYAK